MKSIYQKICKPVSLILVFSSLFLFSRDVFSQSASRWKQQELEFGSDNTWLYITLGVLAAGTITYLIINSSSSDDSSGEKKKKSENKANSKSDSTKIEKTDTTEIKKLIEPDK